MDRWIDDPVPREVTSSPSEAAGSSSLAWRRECSGQRRCAYTRHAGSLDVPVEARHGEVVTTDAERLSRLEGAYEHLATKADVANLKSDIAQLEARLTAAMTSQTRWLVGFVLSAAAAAAGVIIAVDQLAG